MKAELKMAAAGGESGVLKLIPEDPREVDELKRLAVVTTGDGIILHRGFQYMQEEFEFYVAKRAHDNT